MTSPSRPAHGRFRTFFVRGLAILLPTVITLWLLVIAYGFVQDRIAQPINRGIRQLVLVASPWPRASDAELSAFEAGLNGEQRRQWASADPGGSAAGSIQSRWIVHEARRAKIRDWWDRYRWGLDLIGLVIAVGIIFTVGATLGSFIGRRIQARAEQLITRIPIIGRVYPSVKQMTDFFVGDSVSKMRFNKVVAVQYPRTGIWSLGFVTGTPMTPIRAAAGGEVLTVFVPNSPTPFTGFVITARREDTIDLPLTIEEALRFVVSGGLLTPPSVGGPPPAAEIEPPPLAEPGPDPMPRRPDRTA